MLLVLTDQYDKHADRVLEKIDRKNDVARLNLDVEALQDTLVTYQFGNWKIEQRGVNVDINRIRVVWLRKAFVELTLQEQADQSIDFRIWKNEWNKTLLGLYNSIEKKYWVNKIRETYRAENKYYQQSVASAVGFEIPDTIISNRKDELQNFSRRHRDVVIKLMSQEFYESKDNEYLGFYVNKIGENDLSAFGDSKENPIVLQKYINKQYEVRDTVVGSKHFVCKIDSQQSEISKIDWRRYDLCNTPYVAITPPADIAKKVDLLMSEMGLSFGALDFIVTKDNEWIFLEINSMGQWLWIEDLSGLDISGGLVSLFNK